MQQQFPKVKASRALSRDTTAQRTYGSWFQVPSSSGFQRCCIYPSRVFKGKGMPGHMGQRRYTVQNLEVVRVDAENNLLLVKGAVPGPKKCLVTVKKP